MQSHILPGIDSELLGVPDAGAAAGSVLLGVAGVA